MLDFINKYLLKYDLKIVSTKGSITFSDFDYTEGNYERVLGSSFCKGDKVVNTNVGTKRFGWVGKVVWVGDYVFRVFYTEECSDQDYKRENSQYLRKVI